MNLNFNSRAGATRRGTLVAISALAVLVAGGLGPMVSGVRSQQAPNLDVPYVPTPEDVVERMLQMAEVRAGDHLIDLGSGDGRIPITAAKKFGITAFGVDIDPVRVAEAQANAKAQGVADKVKFEVKNLFDTPIADATVMTLYLLPKVNRDLMPRLLAELKPGTRVVSHQFDMGDWAPEQTETMGHRVIYRWTVPARLQGRWRLTQDGGQPIGLELNQDKAVLSGSADVAGKTSNLVNAMVSGTRVVLEIDTGSGTRRFEGQAVGDKIEGKGWRAERVPS